VPEQHGWNVDELIEAQKKDPTFGFIIRLLSEKSTKPVWKEVELQSEDVKNIWMEWDRLSLRDGLLCRKRVELNGNVVWQVLLPPSYRAEFIQTVHFGITGGHLGRHKTEHQVRSRAYWPGWKRQVEVELKRCADCAQYHRGKAPKQTPLQPFCGGLPFEVIAIDITGKHPKSSRGNEYILTITDLFSKYSEAVPLKNHTAPTVAKALVENFILRHGCPRALVSDLGREFESQLFQELCAILEIDKLRTTPYQQQTNGCAERFHRTLNSMLGKVVRESQRDWDEKLPYVMSAYRAAKHESTGYSPYELVYGRKCRMPSDIALGQVTEERQ